MEKLKNAYKDLNPDSSIARQTREIVTQSEAILNAWVEVAADAISNYNLQDGQKNNTPGGVQYSQRYTAENENQDVLNLVKRVQNGEAKANEKVFFGKISQRSAVAIQNITGINVEGFSVALEARQIEHILKRHGENGVADHSMADISNIAKMGYALNSPDSIAPAGKTSAYVSVKNGKNKPADTVLYEKNIGIKSYYVVQAVPETKSKTLYVVSAFIGESGYKNEAPQFTNASSPGATSEIAAVDASSGSISRLEKNSNPEDMLFSSRNVRDAEYMATVESGDMVTAQVVQKNSTPGGVRKSNRNTGYDYSKPFAEQLKDYKSGLIPQGDTLIVGETPDVFRGIGMNALPVTINTRHIDYALNGTKDFDHHLGESLLKQLPNALKSPVAIMTSKTQTGSSVVAMLEIRHNGKQVITPVAIDGFGKQNGIIIDSNAITSVYGKKHSISKVLHDAIEQEANGQFKLFYLNKNKATKLLQEARVPMPKNPATNNGGYIHSLTDANSPVKTKFSSVTESQQFKRWFGDWQNDPANASKVVNADGTPKVVYHQTGGIFTVFDTRREGAGSRDEGTPLGIFLKSTDRDIGLSGKSQMELYADIKNPLRANNRDDLRYKIMQMSSTYATLIAEHNLIDSEYKAKVDNAIKELREFMAEWRAENPDASRRALYDVPRFNELFEAEDTITDEWTAKIAEVSSKAKETMTEALEKNGYDGVFLAEDAGSFGRSTDAFIALRPEQVKSATNNLGTFDADNPDIRFSQRTSAQLERENEKLRSDVAYLKELVQIHKHGNKTVVPERGSVNRQAEVLKKMAGAKELGVKVLAFGTVGHGLLRDDVLTAPARPGRSWGMLAPEHQEQNLAMIRKVKEIADEKGVSLSQLALAWSLAKYDHVQSLIGTTSPEHLHDAIDALNVELTPEDIARMEAALPAEKVGGRGMRNFVFTDGVMSLAR